MNKNNWKSQQVLANELGVKVQVVHNWVRRNNGRVKTKKDENTGMTLVKLIDKK